MSELKWVAAVIVISVIIAVLTYSLPDIFTRPSGDVTAEYIVTYDPHTGKLVERFTYRVSGGGYTMLYRFWKAPLSLEPLGEPHVQLIGVKCPPGAVPYAKDYAGRVATKGPWALEIKEKAYRSEAGCYFPGGVPPGSHVVAYEYVLVPPAEFDGTRYHINLKLADEHVPYTRVLVEIIVPRSEVERVYVHTPTYSIEVLEDRVKVEGWSLENQLLEIELVLAGKGYRVVEKPFNGDVLWEAEASNTAYTVAYQALVGAAWALRIAAVAAPAFFIALYLTRGRERGFTVPSYLHYVPNPSRKPWEVDLLFSGDATTIGPNALYATLLDLKRRGVINIEVSEEDVVLKLARWTDVELDEYERRVVDVIRWYGENGVLSFRKLEERVKDDEGLAREFSAVFGSLIRGMPWMSSYARRFLVKAGLRKYAIAAAILLFLGTVISLIALDEPAFRPCNVLLAAAMGGLIAQSIAIALPPEQVFGRWRDEAYKEFLEWQAFRSFLKDFAMIQKYRPDDLSIWQEWLVYGTALGVGEEVVRAMERLNIPAPAEAALIT
ncbi:MAG: hypothetical protein DRK00_02805, partial [Thermoprotei archaeon]